MAMGDPSTSKEYLKQLELTQAIPTESRCTAIRQEFITDRRHFQIRFILGERGGSEQIGRTPAKGEFPIVALTQATLADEFCHIAITSYGPETKNLFRRWDGQEPKPGMHSGIVASNNIEPASNYPPLALPPESWGGKVSWIDQAFGTGATSSRIVGHELVDSTETVVLERTLPINGSNRNRVYLAYCDLSRGAIPLRIEVYETASGQSTGEQLWSRLNWDGILQENEFSFPQYVIDTVQVKNFDGVWYPVSGRVRQFTPSGPDRLDPLVAGLEWTWDCYQVNTKFTPTPDMFALKFPEETIFVDHTINETRLVGDVDGYAERVIGGIRPNDNRPLGRSLWFWGAVAISISGVLILLWKRLRQNVPNSEATR